MEHKKIRRALVLIAAYFTAIMTLFASTQDDGKNESYPYNDTPKAKVAPYTTCSLGDVYIGNSKTIKKIVANDGNIYIVDERREKNPSMCVIDSYKIRSKEQIMEIIKILLKLEEEDPTEWDRSEKAIYVEWILHTLGFDFGINRVSTRNVDLDNKDEAYYSSIILGKILK